jgi:hypothetical protein
MDEDDNRYKFILFLHAIYVMHKPVKQKRTYIIHVYYDMSRCIKFDMQMGYEYTPKLGNKYCS